MINRNRNSAVDRARAEMKQAVNSSRRQLNCAEEIDYRAQREKKKREKNMRAFRNIIQQAARSKKGKMFLQQGASNFSPGAAKEWREAYNKYGVSEELFNNVSYDVLWTMCSFLEVYALGMGQRTSLESSRRQLDSARIGRAKEVKVLQGNYGYGWDDLIEYEVNDYSSKQDFRDYEENEPQYRHRIIRRRVPNPDYVEKEAVDEIVEVSSSRHMSYKTRKAVEYSINCARRRAGYDR